MDEHVVTDLETLESLYGTPSTASQIKILDCVSPEYRAFIDASPFVVMATAGPEGIEITPRGDPAPVVTLADPKTLLMPDRRGNNRLDSLRNLLVDPRIALFFLIPGIGETLRVSGRAKISTDQALLARFRVKERAPATVLVIAVERVQFHCPKALLRSALWDPSRQLERGALPSAGQMLEAISKGEIGGADFDDSYHKRMAETMY